MSESERQCEMPRSIRQQQILDVAASQRDASIEEIASTIPGVGPDVVEEVLNEYGDPAEGQTQTASRGADQSEDVERTTPDLDELTEKQIEILRAIHEHPDAKQRELADVLDISAPTACNRANSIPGFEWEHRKDFADAVLREELRSTPRGQPTMAFEISDSDGTTQIEQLIERVKALEEKIDDVVAADRSCPSFDDSELALKVVHASLKSEAITEDEELQILDRILG